MKKNFFRTFALCLSFFIILSGCQSAKPKELEKVTVVLNFTVQGDHSPWFVAKEKGYFEEQGLDVDIQRGYGSGDTVQKVLTGAADIGFADIVPLIMAIADGSEVKAIMAGMVSEPSALYSAAEDANIKSPKEMEGKTIGGPPADVSIVLLEAVMKNAGADFNKVEIINMDAATRIPMLASGQIDSAASFYEKESLFGKALDEANKTLVTWRFSDYIDKYSCVALASNDAIENRPETIKKFMLALIKGYEDALEDEKYGADAIMNAHPEFDPDYIYPSATALPDLVWDETTQEKGLGVFSAEKVQNTIEITEEYWDLSKKVSPEEIFTNEFVEWAHKNNK